MNRFDELAERLAELQDQLVVESGVSEQARAKVLAALPLQRSTRSWRGPILVGAGLTAAAAAVAVWIVDPFAERPNFVVNASSHPGAVGEWLSASSTKSLPLDFWDGSQVILAPKAQARVTEIEDEGARVVLERGKITVQVRHRRTTRWQVQAGPFEIAVRGTRFVTQWIPERSELTVALTEGRVDVSGPAWTEERSVSAGETLRVRKEGDGWQPLPRAHAPSAAAVVDESGSVEPAELEALDEPSEVSAVRSAKPAAKEAADPVVVTWQELAKAGDYAGAVTRAKESGIAEILATGSSDQLLSLAQAARFAGDPELSRRVLRAVRERGPGSPAYGVATYDLGRLAFDASGRYLEAAHWFREYLRDYPSGGLAREASGRLVESLERGGDHLGATHAANDYLRRFPSGPHAALARRIAGP